MSTPDLEVAVRRAMQRMQPRGPDDEGLWQGDGICLGHQRLAILDLDHRAAQPMHSPCGRYVIVYNGEIYNFRELRKNLEAEGTPLHTTSDTEVLLALYARDGEGMLPKLRGMFAFVIWDAHTHSVFAARDPYGIKPLYLARTQHGWLLASQVKALLATGMVATTPDAIGQAGFWMLGSVPDPHTWYRDISALPAGTFCRISASGELAGPEQWWDIADEWRNAPTCQMTAPQMQECVRTAVLESVRAHLVSDVPVGVFLSGGIDSGTLAGLMKNAGANDIQGITIAFGEFAGTAQDEVPVAAQIAQHYGIRHHVRTVSQEEFEADLPRILHAMDQPSIDGINTWYASKAVAELGLKVVVSGVGGDELFYGYSSFRDIPSLANRWRSLSRVPGATGLTQAFANHLARRSGNPRWRWFTRSAGNLYGAYWLRRGVFSPNQLHERMDADMVQQLPAGFNPATLVQSCAGTLPDDSAAAIGQLESVLYLRNQLLRDSDWASMDHSVELRTPLVDGWLLRELAPLLRGFGRVAGKELLAHASVPALDDAMINRRKTGFGIPIEHWTRTNGENADYKSSGGSRGWAQQIANAYAATTGDPTNGLA